MTHLLFLFKGILTQPPRAILIIRAGYCHVLFLIFYDIPLMINKISLLFNKVNVILCDVLT